MLLRCFAASDTGALHKPDGIMTEDDRQTLQLHLKSTAIKVNLGYSWLFQQANDAKQVKSGFSNGLSFWNGRPKAPTSTLLKICGLHLEILEVRARRATDLNKLLILPRKAVKYSA